MAKLFSTAQAIADQVDSNRSAAGHGHHFAGHRARLTEEICARAHPGGAARLCLLGAGNASDVDLDRLAACFGEIHLVDIDAEAVRRAQGSAAPETARRLVLHAPVDLSGIFDRLAGWARTPPASPALSPAADAAVARVVAQLPGPFDLVVSCCLLTQLQLALVQVVGDRNPRFADLRALLNRIHVRVLATLIKGQGRALLVTDLTSNDTYPLDDVASDTNLRALMDDLVSVGNVIHAAHPGLLSAEIRRHPEWSADFTVSAPIGPWIWNNGPATTFLVYAMEIAARAGVTSR
jgi:hypothetical protein